MSTASVLIATSPGLKPLKRTGWLETILLFGIPAIALYAAYHFVSPALADSGMPLAEARMIAGGLVLLGMLLASVIGFFLDGQPPTWSAFTERFRLNHMNGRIWLWTLGSTVVYVLLAVIANAVIPLLYRAIGFTPPIDTAEPFGCAAIPLALFYLLLNIFGEELWWRGYILPRQELQLGRYTWLVHGILWAWFHVFKWWTLPVLMIVCLVVPFVAQKTRNTYPGIVSHLIVNGLGMGITIVQLLMR
jgi:membrane protease YdiL (CAAX protease family)